MTIYDSISPIIHQPVVQATMWLVICGAVFTTLQSIFPHDAQQPKIRKDAYQDIFYWIAAPLLYSGIATLMLMAGLWVIFQGNMDKAGEYATKGGAWIADFPLWAQAIMALLFTDLSLYWTHRLFHMGKLWKFHAIHHAATDMDWLTAARFHPFNVICHTVFANSLAIWIGFPPVAIAVLTPFNILYSSMVHANLNWTFGPFKYIFASPVFHRWHHTGPDEGGNMNFAATFTFLDLIFGTYYMPEGKLPGKTGLWEDYVPKNIIGHLIFPFFGKTREEEDLENKIAAE